MSDILKSIWELFCLVGPLGSVLLIFAAVIAIAWPFCLAHECLKEDHKE